MNFLERALNYAEKAYKYVARKDSESDAASKTKKTAKPSVVNKTTTAPAQTKAVSNKRVNSVVNPTGATVDSVGDKVIKTSKTAHTVPKHTDGHNKKPVVLGREQRIQASIANVKNRILQKCQKFGISYKEAEATILSKMQFSYSEFKNASPEEQLADLCCIDGALGLYIVGAKKRKVDSSVDKASLIGQTAKNIKEAKEQGGIDNVEEFCDKVGDVNAELEGKIKDDATEEEYAKILQESRRAFRASVELERAAAIKKCNGDSSKIKEINRRYDARIRAFEAQRQTDFVAAHGSKKARLSIYLRAGKDYSEAHKTVLDMYTGTKKTEVADSFDHDFEMNARRRYYEAGDKVSADEYAKAVIYTTQCMSEKALDKYQQDAHDFRIKVEKGEVKAPYMTEEDFTKESVAIGTGIASNRNISTESKAELLDKWDRNARDFSDYCDVKKAFNSAVKERVSAYSNEAQGFANVNKILSEKYGNNLQTFPKAWEKRNQTSPELKTKALDAVLKSELKTKTISEIKKSYGNSMAEIAGIVLKNDIEYKNRIDEILDYLNTLSGTDIGLKLVGCSTSTISKVIEAFPEKSDEILDIVAPTMCFAGKQRVEQIVKERQENSVV